MPECFNRSQPLRAVWDSIGAVDQLILVAASQRFFCPLLVPVADLAVFDPCIQRFHLEEGGGRRPIARCVRGPHRDAEHQALELVVATSLRKRQHSLDRLALGCHCLARQAHLIGDAVQRGPHQANPRPVPRPALKAGHEHWPAIGAIDLDLPVLHRGGIDALQLGSGGAMHRVLEVVLPVLPVQLGHPVPALVHPGQYVLDKAGRGLVEPILLRQLLNGLGFDLRKPGVAWLEQVQPRHVAVAGNQRRLGFKASQLAELVLPAGPPVRVDRIHHHCADGIGLGQLPVLGCVLRPGLQHLLIG